jgi:DnaK suppressor protein
VTAAHRNGFTPISASHLRRVFRIQEDTMTTSTPPSLALADVQRALERQLEERLAILQALQPYALPTVDPVAFQTAASHRAVIEQITAALNRITRGTYGLCTRCGRPIAPGRLEVLPHAAACIECQSHADAA